MIANAVFLTRDSLCSCVAQLRKEVGSAGKTIEKLEKELQGLKQQMESKLGGANDALDQLRKTHAAEVAAAAGDNAQRLRELQERLESEMQAAVAAEVSHTH